MESQGQGVVHRPLKDKLREHWNTRDQILAPKPEKANSMGITFSWVYSIVTTLTLSYVILPELDFDHGVWHQVFLWVDLVMVMSNWILCAKRYPVTKVNVPQREQTSAEMAPLPRDWTSCPLCQLDVPPRTHHCKVCGMCILKRDHHCFFTGTCIGWRNQRRFIVFLFYTILGGLYAICLLTMYLADSSHDWSYQWFNYLPGISFFSWLFGNIPLGDFSILLELYASCVVFFAAAGFFIWEICMVFRGQTSFEAAHSKIKYRCGPLESFRNTFGDYGLIHFLVPLSLPQRGDGVTWPVYKYYKNH